MTADPAHISVTAKVSAYYRKFSDIAFANRNETKHLPYGEGTLRADPLREALNARLVWQRQPRLAIAELGDLAGNVGAHLLAGLAFAEASRERPTQ